ncbi:hypothetical protein [Piscibacillus salipiscarius]|uniref:Uncharacterized protein n=1 Tax=Piscibacillus salipiscarius TaxID=299480 RepID=A0ABW5QCJ2_9BACI|nr:hypothetical protein [Piscibacillus salipiscarius]
MFNKTKYLLIILTVTLQISAIVAIFYNTTLAVTLAVLYLVALILLILLFVYERRIEKKGELNYDDLDY